MNRTNKTRKRDGWNSIEDKKSDKKTYKKNIPQKTKKWR